MPTAQQRSAAKRNIKRAQEAARKKKTIAPPTQERSDGLKQAGREVTSAGWRAGSRP